VKMLRVGRIRRRLPLRTACNRRRDLRVAIIGTSSGPCRTAICREPMTAFFRRPILFIYQVIALKYHLPSKGVFSKLYACAREVGQALRTSVEYHFSGCGKPEVHRHKTLTQSWWFASSLAVVLVLSGSWPLRRFPY
jgi:hypothetical protein